MKKYDIDFEHKGKSIHAFEDEDTYKVSVDEIGGKSSSGFVPVQSFQKSSQWETFEDFIEWWKSNY